MLHDIWCDARFPPFFPHPLTIFGSSEWILLPEAVCCSSEASLNSSILNVIAKFKPNVSICAGCLTSGARDQRGRSGSTASRTSPPSSSASPCPSTTRCCTRTRRRWVAGFLIEGWAKIPKKCNKIKRPSYLKSVLWAIFNPIFLVSLVPLHNQGKVQHMLTL